MISSRFYKALQQRGLQTMMSASQTPFTNTPVRFFSKDQSEEGEEPAAAEEAIPEPKKAAPKAAPKKAAASDEPWATVPHQEPLDKALFQPFSVGNIKVIESTPDHKPPSEEDTIEGRYSQVLFTTASQNGDLFNVYEDLRFMQEIYKNSEIFRQFTENGGVGSKEIRELNSALTETAPFCKTTLRFLVVLAENKRLSQVIDIAKKYVSLYAAFNKEEKITIISASELTADQKTQVVSALQANPVNEGKQFTIVYETDELILGGLQMYTESEFMDMSLSSRLDRISSEVSKLGN